MQELTQHRSAIEADSFVEVEDDRKELLVDRQAVFDSVSYLLDHGLTRDEVQRCLVRYFYVDLDLLNEALTAH
ncbi:MAG: hypothetical protein KF914_16630 [Rhizobiaceae bacterium]|nr:hypothetical protein [Rhizobiaceae bacterium]